MNDTNTEQHHDDGRGNPATDERTDATSELRTEDATSERWTDASESRTVETTSEDRTVAAYDDPRYSTASVADWDAY